MNAENIIIIGEITAYSDIHHSNISATILVFGRHLEFEAKIKDAVSLIFKRRLL